MEGVFTENQRPESPEERTFGIVIKYTHCMMEKGKTTTTTTTTTTKINKINK